MRNEHSVNKAAGFSIAILVTLGVLATAMISTPVAAATKTVVVTVTRCVALDPVDSASAADFYLWVTFNGYSYKSAEPIALNDNDITPNFARYFTNVPSGSGQAYTLVIELWDDDGGSSADDCCDISRDVNHHIAIMTYYIDSGTWTGDDGYAGDPNVGRVGGDEYPDGGAGDEDDCWLTFTIARY